MTTQNVIENRTLKRSQKRLIFYIIMVAIPILQFSIFYVYVNFNVIVMAFQKYSFKSNGLGYDVTFAGFENFAAVFNVLKTDSTSMVWTSILGYLVNLCISMPLALLFSFYIYKKCPLSGFFKTMLFMPQLLCSVVLVMLYKYMVTDVYMSFTGATKGLIDSNPLAMILFFSIWMSFGANILIYSGAMSGINVAVVESAELDGAVGLKEFYHITLPMIFPTFVTFFIMGLSGIFSNQLNLFTFYENSSSIQTVGYYLYVQSLNSGLIANSHAGKDLTWLSYSEVAAFGLIITAVVFPTTLFIRRFLEKYGPSTN